MEATSAESKPDGKSSRTVLIVTAVIIATIINALITSFLIYGYDRRYAQKIAAVDLFGYVQKMNKMVLEGKLSSDEYKRSLDILDETIKNAPKSHVVLSGDVVLRNAEKLAIENPILEKK